jgi:hypothetical protein
MESFISLYKKRLNLPEAQFTFIDHEDAMVAAVFRISKPGNPDLILKVCSRKGDFLRESYFLNRFADKIPVPKIIRLIARWSLVQVQLAPLFPHILLSRFLSITQMLRKPHFTQFLRNRPQTTSAIQSNTSFYRPIFLKSFPTSPFFRGNSGNSGNATPFHFIFSNLQFI